MGKFTFTQTEIPGVVVIEPQVFGDDRGYFMETYQKDQFAEAGIDKEFVQDNQSRSTRGVLRGLHFQKNHTQGKLVRVTKGEVFDVAVDCRPHSATFGKWVGVTLSEENKKMFYIQMCIRDSTFIISSSSPAASQRCSVCWGGSAHRCFCSAPKYMIPRKKITKDRITENNTVRKYSIIVRNRRPWLKS